MLEKELCAIMKKHFSKQFSIEPRRSDLYQIYLPLYYPDGDMIDIFIKTSSTSSKLVICDCGLTLMHLSYEFSIDTGHKEVVFNNIINESGVCNDNGNIYLETTPDMLFFSTMQLYQCLEKIYGMKLLKKENIKTMFYENIDNYVTNNLSSYSPIKNYQPIADLPETVDYCLMSSASKPIFIFAAQGQNKALSSVISMLTFQREQIPFTSIVVHDNFYKLSKDNQKRIINVADKQFYDYDSFKSNGISYICRIA